MEQTADTMENYILKLIADCKIKIDDPDIHKGSFQYYAGARDYLYMVLTGHNNPQSNPKDNQK